MPSPVPPLAAALAALLALPPPAARAQVGGEAFPPGAPPMPVCNAPREGVAACLGGVSCLCRFERGGLLTGRPDGFRWDCGALRPRCGVAPAELPPSAFAPPPPVPVFPQVTVPPPGVPFEDEGAFSRGPPFPRVWR